MMLARLYDIHEDLEYLLVGHAPPTSAQIDALYERLKVSLKTETRSGPARERLQ